MNQNKSLDIDRIEAARKEAHIGRKVVLFQSTGSTNDIAWEYSKNINNDGLCVLAESQTKGRGRRGRTWHSEPGQSILCSVLLRQTTIELELLTLAAGVAAAETINSTIVKAMANMHNHGQARLDRTTQLQCRIKWPNDILIQSQKVAGILIEKRTINNQPAFVIGIGINCNQTAGAFEDCQLNLPATSLAIQTSNSIDRTELVCELLKQIQYWLEKSKDPITERWLQLSGMLGQHITIECDGLQYSGFCRGVDPAEGLILHLDNSLIRMFSAAQTSLVI